jgi:hypothetical protein
MFDGELEISAKMEIAFNFLKNISDSEVIQTTEDKALMRLKQLLFDIA